MKNPFAHILGNEPIKDFLVRMVEKDAIAHSLLFAGPDGVGKSLFAEAFASLILCQQDPEGTHRKKIANGVHPDLRIYRPEGKIGLHSIDSMRQFSEEVYQPPYEASRKVFIIHEADRMLPASANALLKTFEEPALSSIIILLSSAAGAMLPTILSRCQTLHFHVLPQPLIAQFLQTRLSCPEPEAHAFAALAEGSIGNACTLAEGSGHMRMRLLQMLVQGRFSSYTQLMQAAVEMSGYIDESQKKMVEMARGEMLKAYPGEPTAVQQQTIDKELDGMGAMHLATQARTLFAMVLSWHRDMHLIAVQGDQKLLINRDFEEQIIQALQKGEMLTLEKVQEVIAQATLSLQRSTPLRSCLENLFLSLNFL